MNAVNGFLEGFFLATFKINNLVFYGNDVGVVNDKEVQEADACVGLTRIDVLLPLLQKNDIYWPCYKLDGVCCRDFIS